MSVKIVPMTADHIDEIAALERACFSRPWSREMLKEELVKIPMVLLYIIILKKEHYHMIQLLHKIM